MQPFLNIWRHYLEISGPHSPKHQEAGLILIHFQKEKEIQCIQHDKLFGDLRKETAPLEEAKGLLDSGSSCPQDR